MSARPLCPPVRLADAIRANPLSWGECLYNLPLSGGGYCQCVVGKDGIPRFYPLAGVTNERVPKISPDSLALTQMEWVSADALWVSRCELASRGLVLAEVNGDACGVL